MPFMCSLLPNRKLIFSIHFSCREMQWNGMTLLYNGMLFVCLSCKSVSRFDSIIRIELSFCCSLETMVSYKVKWISLTPG